MSTMPPNTLSQESPGPRAIRFWLGLLVALMLVIQFGATVWAYSHWSDTRTYDTEDMHFYWHRFVLAIASAVLAMLFIIGETGLILNFGWAWRLILCGAILQILVTVATQVWEASLLESLAQTGKHYLPGYAWMGAIIGSVVWNIVPVGILVLAAAGRKKSSPRA